MLTHTFHSNIRFGGSGYIQQKFDEIAVKNEPMLFQCDLATARKLGGPITHSFLWTLERQQIEKVDLDNLIIDSRVHMLMPGWFACIPGYHHDLVPRTRADGQPNYDNPEYHANHCMMLINGDICPTEFALGVAQFNEVQLGQKVYKQWHKEVEQKLEEDELFTLYAPSDTLIFFDCDTWHTGTKAVANGWRYFIRASWNHTEKPRNELRRQVQVYMENPVEGW